MIKSLTINFDILSVGQSGGKDIAVCNKIAYVCGRHELDSLAGKYSLCTSRLREYSLTVINSVTIVATCKI